MTDLDEVRKHWIEVEPRYAEYGALLAADLTVVLRECGLWFEISHRPKSTASLIKKLIKKPKHSFETIPDKVGIRIVLRYRSDLHRVVEKIQAALHCGKVDWKAPKADQIGYQSVHIDYLRLKDSNAEQRRFPVNDYWAELQIRTQAQHLWSEMSHDSIYKNDETILLLSDDVKRRVNLMAGQIEVADREFDRLAAETAGPPEAAVLRFLEPFFYKFASTRYDVELSLIVIRTLLPLFGNDIPALEARAGAFLDAQTPFLRNRYALAEHEGGVESVSPLFFQPEALLVYELLKDDDLALRQAWRKSLPEKELEKLAKDFGFSFV